MNPSNRDIHHCYLKSGRQQWNYNNNQIFFCHSRGDFPAKVYRPMYCWSYYQTTIYFYPHRSSFNRIENPEHYIFIVDLPLISTIIRMMCNAYFLTICRYNKGMTATGVSGITDKIILYYGIFKLGLLKLPQIGIC